MISISSISNILNILSAAAVPFIATWKKEPSCLRGIKNSADKRIMMSIFKREILPLLNSEIPIIMPIAEPPNATKSITEIELSCIINTFIVAFLKSSAFLFISICFCSSQPYILRVVSPCIFSRKVSPKFV